MYREKEYIIFCDESERDGKYYSNFYGGLIVGASQYERVTAKLNECKKVLNLHGEIKWEKVTERYLDKYIELMRCFFTEIIATHVKIRIMFCQNAHKPVGLNFGQAENAYFLLYYQFVKHCFGLECMNGAEGNTNLRLYFDRFPHTGEKAEQFKGFLLAMQENAKFHHAGLRIAREDIAEVRSHEHVLLQCLDVVLGSMAFRLNDKQKAKLPGQRFRGKRTRAKESLYKKILGHICEIKPRFNIGITTGETFRENARWNDAYRHWAFKARETEYDKSLTKRGEKKAKK